MTRRGVKFVFKLVNVVKKMSLLLEIFSLCGSWAVVLTYYAIRFIFDWRASGSNTDSDGNTAVVTCVFHNSVVHPSQAALYVRTIANRQCFQEVQITYVF